MISSNSVNQLSTDYCKYGLQCGKIAIHHCHGCGQIFCMDHHLQHQKKLQKSFKYVIHLQYLLNQNLNILILQSSTTVRLNFEIKIQEFKMKSNKIDKAINEIQQKLHDIISENKEELTNELESEENNYLENDIERLRTDIEELNSELKKEINYDNQTRLLQDEKEIEDDDGSSGEEMVGVIDFNTTSKINHKIHLSHNYIRWIRGPAKKLIHGMTHATEIYTQRKNISDTIVQTVRQGLNKQQQTINNVFKPLFAEITSDWMFEGENTDPGFISASLWMRNPQNQRILVKTHGHPLCAVNEWLAYILGKLLHLPVNEVQIAIYQSKLVTLHTDIAHENEKTLMFMDLPKQIQRRLLTYPIMESMDLFDHIIQNVDRTPRNILITMSNTTAVIDDMTALKIHLIDHSFSFGVGKHDIINAIACKLHSKHFSVVKFDPTEEGRKFEQYLNKLPIADHTLIEKTLNYFAAITDDEFNRWMTEVRDLLSLNQYNRIYDVLRRQRDIAKYYSSLWGISSNS